MSTKKNNLFILRSVGLAIICVFLLLFLTNITYYGESYLTHQAKDECREYSPVSSILRTGFKVVFAVSLAVALNNGRLLKTGIF